MDSKILLAVFLLCAIGVDSYAPIVYMNLNCYNEETFVYDANLLKLNPIMIYDLPGNCSSRFVSSDAYENFLTLRLYLQKFNVPCNEGTVTFKGFGVNDGRYCGGIQPPTTFKSTDETGIITFQKNPLATSFTVSTLQILVTKINDGFCSSTEFMCDNLDCIDKVLLTCDGNNNCGDDSDESSSLCVWTYPVIVGVSLGCGLFFGLIVLVVSLRYRRRRMARVACSNTTYGQNVTQPIYVQQQYQYGSGIQPPPYATSPPPYQETVIPKKN